jgi:hypothetical protein
MHSSLFERVQITYFEWSSCRVWVGWGGESVGADIKTVNYAVCRSQRVVQCCNNEPS